MNNRQNQFYKRMYYYLKVVSKPGLFQATIKFYFLFAPTLVSIFPLNPGAPGAGQRGHFRLSSLILRDTEVIATHGFLKNSGHRFLTDMSIQNTNNMKDRLTIKNN